MQKKINYRKVAIACSVISGGAFAAFTAFTSRENAGVGAIIVFCVTLIGIFISPYNIEE